MNPLLLDLPASLETEHLLIRFPQPGDGAMVNRAVVSNLPRLKPWFPWAQNAPTPEESEAIVRRNCIKIMERSDLMLLVLHKETGEMVASSGLHRINWDVPKFEIGYWATSDYEGKGLVTEAVQGIAAFAFDTLHANRVEIRCDPANTRSARVAEKCGFFLEARLKNDARDTSGSLRDTLVFARTA